MAFAAPKALQVVGLLSLLFLFSYTTNPRLFTWFEHTRCLQIMEALAAISLAGNILQFIQFSSVLVAKAVEYQSSSFGGMLQSHVRVEQSLHDLDTLLQQLNNSRPQRWDSKVTTPADQALQVQIEECARIGRDMRSALARVKMEGGRSIFKSTRKAWRAIWTEKYIEELETSLRAVRDRMNLQLTVDQRAALGRISENQDAIVSRLDNVALQIYRNVLDGLEPLRVDSRLISKQLTQIHDDRSAITSQLDTIDAKLNLLVKDPHTVTTPLTSSVSSAQPKLGDDVDLYRAVAEGRTEQVIDYIKQGLDVNATNYSGDVEQRPIHLAAKQSFQGAKMLKVLLNVRPELEVCTGTGVTPLMIASIADNLAGVRELIKAGASIERALKPVRQSPLYTIDIDNAITSGSTALFLAAQNGHDAVVKELLASGANIEVATNHGFTPLIAAAIEGSPDVVSTLLSAGASVDDATDQGFTSLIYAAHKGFIDVAKILLDQGGANLEAAKYGGMTSLLEALWTHQTAMVDFLCARGANKSARSSIVQGMEGFTAGHLAAAFGDAKIMKVLLKHGFDRDLTDNAGRTAEQVAREQNQHVIVKLFEESAPSTT